MTKQKVRDLLVLVGPGAIVASATIGAGETVLAVRVGAWSGYDLLWLILLAVLTKSFLTLYMMGRFSSLAGKPAAQELVNFPGPRGWFLWALLALELAVAPFVFVVIAVPSGRLLADLLMQNGIEASYKVLACAFLGLAVGIAMMQSFKTLEGSQGIVCLVLLVGTLGATVLVAPDLGAIIKGLLRVGYFPAYPEWIPDSIRNRSPLLEMASVFGYSGSIAINYVVYSDWVVLKGWVKQGDSPAKAALRPVRWDVGFNSIVVLLVTATFMIAGAAILRPLHKIPNGFDLLNQQAEIFARISPAIVPLYYVTILAALWGTLNALPEIYTRAAQSFLSQLVPRIRWSYRFLMYLFGMVLMVTTAVLVWTETTPIVMVDLVALFSTNIGVALVAVSSLWLDSRLPPELRCSRLLWWATAAGSAVIIFMSLLSAREVVTRYLG